MRSAAQARAPACAGARHCPFPRITQPHNRELAQTACSSSMAPACSAGATPSSSSPGCTGADAHVSTSRRTLLGAALAAVLLGQQRQAAAADAVVPADIRPSLAPDESKYDPTDPELRAAAAALQEALNAPSVQEEERLWTVVIDTYGGLDRPWVPDVVGRAWGNRGNARSRQGRLEEALADYDESIRICPWSVDPVLNRGVALEALGRFEEAVADYRAVLAVAPADPAAWNNLGNATGGLGRWDEAVGYYGRAVELAPNFSFAAANRALALFEVGQTDQAMREMRALLRRYPDFADMRAGLTAALWAIGKEGDAETSWSRVDDPRYADMGWIRFDRRWPPRVYKSLMAFLELRSLPAL